MASRKASRMVIETISVPSGMLVSAATLDTGASGDFGAGFSSDFSTLAGDAASADFSAFGFDAGLAALMSALLSPSLKITAIGVLTATSAVPSATRILPMVPSSVASTSMVALSVSISAMISPDLTLSPSFLSHLAKLPFSIVGESAGMSTSIGMGATVSYAMLFLWLGGLTIDVGIEL